MADSTQGGGHRNRHIHLTKQPARPSLAEAMRILNLLNSPTESKFAGGSVRRMVLTPKAEHTLVSIVGPNSLYFANTVGEFGSVSVGRNWDRLPSASHWWDLKLAEEWNSLLLFSYGALVLAESEISEVPWLVVIFPNDSIIHI